MRSMRPGNHAVISLRRVWSYVIFPNSRSSWSTQRRSTGTVRMRASLRALSDRVSTRSPWSCPPLDFTGIRSIPQMGHLPGSCSWICGCIEHVQRLSSADHWRMSPRAMRAFMRFRISAKTASSFQSAIAPGSFCASIPGTSSYGERYPARTSRCVHQSSAVILNRGPRLPVIGERIMRRSASQFWASASSPMYMPAKRSARSRSRATFGSARPKA